MEISNNAWLLKPRQTERMQHLASSVRRSVVAYFDNMEDIHNEVMETLLMSEQARQGYYEPLLSIESREWSEWDFYKSIDTFPKAEKYFNVHKNIFNSTIANKVGLDDNQRKKEIDNSNTEMDRAARIMDTLTRKNTQNKKNGA